MSRVQRVLRFALDLLYPPKCPFCRKLLKSSGDECSCSEALRKPEQSALRNNGGSIDQWLAAFSYEGTVRESLHRYKFSGAQGYAEQYARYLQKTVDESDVSCDSITWVPLSSKRKRKRGYDQAELLARALSARTGIPCERMLVKTRNNTAQSGAKSAAERLENVKDVYALHKGASVAGRRILLVDDILTTGATAGECARVLKNNGAAYVCAAALARTPEIKRR